MVAFTKSILIFGFFHVLAGSNNPSASPQLVGSILASMSEYLVPYGYDSRRSRIIRSPQESNSGSDPTNGNSNEDDDTLDDPETDPRIELNEYEQESDPRNKLNTFQQNNTSDPNIGYNSDKPNENIVGEIRLPPNYDKNRIPILTINGTVHPIPVLQFTTIYSLLDFDESNEKITLDMDTIIVWVDGYLYDQQRETEYGGTNGTATFPNSFITLNPIFLRKLWTPDIYIDNLLRVGKPSYMSSPVSLKFNPTLGYIQYRSRVAITLKCPMKFQYYPADTQKCHFFFKSFAYFSDQLKLLWAPGTSFINPADANFDIQIDKLDQGAKGEQYRDKIRTHDCLEFYFIARRKLSYHLIQTYIPSVFFIIITWLAFLLPPSMVEGRIAVAMTTLLTLSTMFGAVRESTPAVSYIKAIDVWMIFCVLFVFLTLVEFAFLAWLETERKKSEEKRKYRRDLKREKRQQKVEAYDAGDEDDIDSQLKDQTMWEKIGWFIEKYAFPIFSVIFLLFVVVYWSWLLLVSEYFSWEVNRTYNKFPETTGWYVSNETANLTNSFIS